MPGEVRRLPDGWNPNQAKVYRPTWDEFKDFNEFIKRIEKDGADELGICKVIPPKEWIPRKKGYKIDELDFTIDRPIVQRFTAFGDRGAYQTKGVAKSQMTVPEYYDLCNSNRYAPPTFKSHDDVERKYWKSIMYSSPIYGCDVAAPLSDQDLKEWNISNLGCILDLVKQNGKGEIKGVLSPYLYFGMWQATFSWHIEDLDLYAINAVHYGAPKTWYCIPPKYGYMLEQLTKRIFPSVSKWCTNFMRHKTCLISPQVLEKHGIPYQKLVQEEREIIITFPYAYHQGFNHGFNIAESTNFATERWVEFGKRSKPCDCELTRVQFPMEVFVQKFQPERYNDWINKKDIAPHPMDPPEVAKKVKLQSENPQEYAKLMASSLVKKTRGSEEKEKNGNDKDGKKSVRYNLYQHHQLANVLVQYNPTTGKTRRGAARLANFFDDPNIPQLIDQGYLIKVGTIKCSSKAQIKPTSLKYKCLEEGFIVKVHPESLEVVGQPSQQLTDYLQRKNADLKTLIRENLFKEMQAPKIRSVTVQKGIKKRLFLQAYKTKLITLVKLKHVESNTYIKVWPKKLEPAYKLPSKMSSLLKSSSVKDLMKERILVSEGEVQSQMKQLANKPVSAPATLTCDLYYTARTKLPVRVAKNGNVLLDRAVPHIKELSKSSSIQDLLASKRLVYSSTVELTRRDSKFEETLHDETYDPEDLIPESDLIDQFVYENDPDCPIEGASLSSKKRKLLASRQERLRAIRLKNVTPVCEATVATMTREIVAHFISKYSDKKCPTFDLEYFKRFCSKDEDEDLLVPILYILEDMRIFTQDKENPKSYLWLGPDATNFKETFCYFLERSHKKKKEENRYKVVFREVLLLLLETRKGIRVHLKHLALTKFGKFVEVRRVSLASGVLQGLDLVQPVEGDLNTVTWIGDNTFLDWSRAIERQHFSLSSVVSLPKCQVDSDQVQHCLDQLNVWLRSTMNANTSSSDEPLAKKPKVCKCGYIKGVNVITNIKGKITIRKGVIAGNKRRTRCNACENCLRAPCLTCMTCTKKSLKKPCIYRVCNAPKNPNCPCFANDSTPFEKK